MPRGSGRLAQVCSPQQLQPQHQQRQPSGLPLLTEQRQLGRQVGLRDLCEAESTSVSFRSKSGIYQRAIFDQRLWDIGNFHTHVCQHFAAEFWIGGTSKQCAPSFLMFIFWSLWDTHLTQSKTHQGSQVILKICIEAKSKIFGNIHNPLLNKIPSSNFFSPKCNFWKVASGDANMFKRNVSLQSYRCYTHNLKADSYSQDLQLQNHISS